MLNITLVDYHTDMFVGVIKMVALPVKHEKIYFFGRNYEAVYNTERNGNVVALVERVENGQVVGLYDYMGDSADD